MARKHSAGRPSRQWKGVRKRAWGRWVCEIRHPSNQQRIWLGSYATAEEAARAYDAASLCLRGPSAPLNFPSSSISPTLLHSHRPPLSKTDIQLIAAAAAAGEAARNESRSIRAAPPSLTHIQQESRPILSQEVVQSTPMMHNSMELPSYEMQASLPNQIFLLPQSTTSSTMPNTTEFSGLLELEGPSMQHQIHLPPLQSINGEVLSSRYETQGSTQHQDHLLPQSAAPMFNHTELSSYDQAIQASERHQICTPSQSAAAMHNLAELPSHEIRASTHLHSHLLSQGNSATVCAPTAGVSTTAHSSPLSEATAHLTPRMLHLQPSAETWHRAIPAMARHFLRKAQVRARDSSNPIREAQDSLIALPSVRRE